MPLIVLAIVCSTFFIFSTSPPHCNDKPIETAFGVDISQNAVEQYAETHLGRKPRNHQEFCAAREAKIIEESKEL